MLLSLAWNPQGKIDCRNTSRRPGSQRAIHRLVCFRQLETVQFASHLLSQNNTNVFIVMMLSGTDRVWIQVWDLFYKKGLCKGDKRGRELRDRKNRVGRSQQDRVRPKKGKVMSSTISRFFLKNHGKDINVFSCHSNVCYSKLKICERFWKTHRNAAFFQPIS